MRIFVNEFCGHAFQMELSRRLASLGHVVYHVYFADNTSTPKGDTHKRPDDPPGLTIQGLHIRRKFEKHSLLSRRQADVEYGKVAADCLDRFQPDLVISANMPLDAQEILQAAAFRRHAAFVFWIQDIYTLAATFVLRKKANFLAWAGGAYFERLEKKLLRRSDAIVCISPGFEEFLGRWGISGSKVHVIENWAPLHEVSPRPKVNPWAEEHGVSQKFCFMYSGTLGMKHRPELLLELARFLQDREDAALIVIAGGAGADWLSGQAHEIRPGILTLLPFQPYDRLSEVLASADALISLLDSEAGMFSVPSKTLSYLCAGRAQIIGAPSINEAARVVQRAQAGMVVSPDDPAELLQAAKHLLDDRRLCAVFGENARAYAERSFSIDRITQHFLNIFEPLCSRGSTHGESPSAGSTSADSTNVVAIKSE